MKFKSEKQLFDTALNCQSFTSYFSYCPTKFLVEPKGLFGVPDLVVANVDCNESPSQLICAAAFEMKLKNWQRAIIQAYRYRSFAEISYVMLDKAYIKPALRNLDAFKRSNIGLLSIDYNGDLIKHYHPQQNTPYCNSLRGNLENIVLNCNYLHKPEVGVCH